MLNYGSVLPASLLDKSLLSFYSPLCFSASKCWQWTSFHTHDPHNEVSCVQTLSPFTLRPLLKPPILLFWLHTPSSELPPQLLLSFYSPLNTLTNTYTHAHRITSPLSAPLQQTVGLQARRPRGEARGGRQRGRGNRIHHHTHMQTHDLKTHWSWHKAQTLTLTHTHTQMYTSSCTCQRAQRFESFQTTEDSGKERTNEAAKERERERSGSPQSLVWLLLFPHCVMGRGV